MPLTIVLFSVAVAAASTLAFGSIEAGLALGVLVAAAVWLGFRAFRDS